MQAQADKYSSRPAQCEAMGKGAADDVETVDDVESVDEVETIDEVETVDDVDVFVPHLARLLRARLTGEDVVGGLVYTVSVTVAARVEEYSVTTSTTPVYAVEVA